MLKNLFRRRSTIPSELYGAVVAQSREPFFYTDLQIPDTPTGRFDILCLHMFLLSRRLVREDTAIARELNQEVFDLFTEDLDRALRELGVGDPTVPKRKKKMIRGFYGQVEDFASELDTGKLAPVTEKVHKRFYGSAKKNLDEAAALARYMVANARILDGQSASKILAGKLEWRDPEIAANM